MRVLGASGRWRAAAPPQRGGWESSWEATRRLLENKMGALRGREEHGVECDGLYSTAHARSALHGVTAAHSPLLPSS